MRSPAPVIFINRGNSPFLFLACTRACQTNPGREIILLGDSSTAHYRWIPGIQHINFSPYQQGARRLAASFENDSSNGMEFELICLQRWFILHEFLAGRGTEARGIYFDSDILVYDNLRVPEADFAPYGMTFQKCSGHVCFINSSFVLGEFVQFILDHYENPACKQALKNHTESVRQTVPAWNASDMSFFLMFHDRHPDKMTDLHFPIKDRYALDQTVDTDYGGFELENGLKKIVWQNGRPYCRHLPTGKFIQFYTLHFQGESKKLMRHFCPALGTWANLGYSVNQIYYWVWYFLRAIQRRIAPYRCASRL